MIFLFIFSGARANLDRPEIHGSCGGVLEDFEGTFATMNFPSNNYPALANCTWEVIVKPKHRIEMQILYIDINDTDGCYNDYVSVTDGGQEIARYCGEPHVEFPLLSSSNKVLVTFISDEKLEGAGFAAAWKQGKIMVHRSD